MDSTDKFGALMGSQFRVRETNKRPWPVTGCVEKEDGKCEAQFETEWPWKISTEGSLCATI